jgi:hypothetical protein
MAEKEDRSSQKVHEIGDCTLAILKCRRGVISKGCEEIKVLDVGILLNVLRKVWIVDAVLA